MIKPVILAIPNVSCHFIGMGTIFLYRKIKIRNKIMSDRLLGYWIDYLCMKNMLMIQS